MVQPRYGSTRSNEGRGMLAEESPSMSGIDDTAGEIVTSFSPVDGRFGC